MSRYAATVCGLASRWPMSLSVKNASRSGASVAHARSSAVDVESFGDQIDQLGHRRTDTSRSWSGRRGRDRSTAGGGAGGRRVRLDTTRSRTAPRTCGACRVPAGRRRPGADVRPAACTRRGNTVLTLYAKHAGPDAGGEEARRLGFRAALVASAGIARGARRPWWDATAPGGTCRTWCCGSVSDALVEVDVVVVEPNRLADSHPGHGEEPDQGLVGVGPMLRSEPAAPPRGSGRCRCRSRCRARPGGLAREAASPGGSRSPDPGR